MKKDLKCYLVPGVLCALLGFSLASMADPGIIGRIELHPPNGNGVGPKGIAYDGGQLFIANFNSHNLSIASNSGDVIWTVDVGLWPRDVAVDIGLQKAFVTNGGSDSVSVVDSADWNVLDTIAVGAEPLSVAVNQSTHRAYVSNHGPATAQGTTVTVINTSSHAVIDTVDVDGRPGYIAIDETANKIYVMLWLDSRIAVIDGETNAVGHFQGFSIYHGDIAINLATNRLYLLDYSASKIAAYDLTTKAYAAQTLIGGSISRMDMDTENDKLYVVYSDYGVWGGAAVVDLATSIMEDWVEIGGYVDPENVAVAPDQGYFYIICSNKTLRQHRISDLGLVQVEPIGVSPISVAANGASGKVYTALQSVPEEPGDVYVTAEVPEGYKLRIPVDPEPNSVAVNPVTNRIYVTHDGEPYGITVIDGATDSVLTTIADVRGDELAIDPLANRLYAISGGRYFPIDGGTNTVLPMVLTRYSSSGYIAVDPVLDRVYVSSTFSRGRLMVHDGTTGEEITYLSLGGTDIAVDTVNHIVYAGDWDAGVNVVDGTTNTLITEIPTPIEARYLAFDPVERRLYVGDTESEEVVVIDGATNTIIGSVTTDSGIFHLAADGVTPRAYVSNRAAGTVVMVGEPQPVPAIQRLALVALYNSTGGPDWTDNTNWLSGDPCVNNWHGVSCLEPGAGVTGLVLHDNGLEGSIPVEMNALTDLQELKLGSNRLGGGVPAQLGALDTLQKLDLSANRLTGPVPDEWLNLVGLQTGWLDLGFNCLYTGSAVLDSFLDGKTAGDWSLTQTVAPLNVTVDEAGGESALLSWDAIEFTGESGRYRYYYSQAPGGPFQEGGTTPDKSLSSGFIDGLSPNLDYYFVVHTETDSHAGNGNDLVSGESEEVSVSPRYVDERLEFDTDFDFLTQPLDGTPFNVMDFNEGFGEPQNATVVDMESNSIEPGSLVITSQNADWSDDQDDGVFLGRRVFGDFLSELTITDMDAIEGHQAGLMIRVPAGADLAEAGPGQDWVAIGVDGAALQVHSFNTDNGVTTSGAEPAPAFRAAPDGLPENAIHLRVERWGSGLRDGATLPGGSMLRLYYRVGDSGAWIETVMSPLERPDFTSYELEVGIWQASGGLATAVIDKMAVRSDTIFKSGFD